MVMMGTVSVSLGYVPGQSTRSIAKSEVGMVQRIFRHERVAMVIVVKTT